LGDSVLAETVAGEVVPEEAVVTGTVTDNDLSHGRRLPRSEHRHHNRDYGENQPNASEHTTSILVGGVISPAIGSYEMEHTKTSL